MQFSLKLRNLASYSVDILMISCGAENFNTSVFQESRWSYIDPRESIPPVYNGGVSPGCFENRNFMQPMRRLRGALVFFFLGEGLFVANVFPRNSHVILTMFLKYPIHSLRHSQ